MTRTTPLRLITLQFSQILLTELRTFIILPYHFPVGAGANRLLSQHDPAAS